MFLSGNGPLVKVLRENSSATRSDAKGKGRRITKSVALSEVKMFIQNIHHFRDSISVMKARQWIVMALFDEAQRAWN